MGIIVCIALQASAVAYIGTSETPTWFNTLLGTHVSGDNDDLQHIDGNAVHWEGNWYILPDLSSGWIFESALFFNVPSRTYSYVYLVTTFKAGDIGLRIIVFYTNGYVDEFYPPSTGGVFKTMCFTLQSYSKVHYIHFRSADDFQQHLYVDYAEIGYDV
ncbi:MAG: hypothetical protein ACFFDF_06895 [Candidatus Odinarchaeota archaeon]